MTVKLYELAAADTARRFSPYCWRARLALLHKGLAFETIPWRFTEKDSIAFSGQGLVPVLVDGERTVSDSWAIAEYLDQQYPDRPSLFGGDAGRELTRFMQNWVATVVQAQLIRMVVLDIHDHLDEKDQPYFRQSREHRFGATLESVVADREERLPAFRESLLPLRLTLKTQPFLAGERPLYADYIAFSAFQWARCISPLRLLAEDDPVYAWRERMLDLFEADARRAVGY